MKRTTIKDIAQVAGVSYATVSRALSGSPEIGEKTRERIRLISEEMGYTTNYIAQSMVLKQTKLIGLIVSGIVNPFVAELAYHIESRVRELGYSLLLCNSSNDLDVEQHMFKLLLGRQVDGIIVMPAHTESYQKLSEYIATTPTVFIGENFKDMPESYVAVDNYRGTRIGMEFLFSLGHRDIIYFGRRKNSVTHQHRAEGYLSACKEMGVESQVINSNFQSSSIAAGMQMARQLFSKPLSATAIFAATDTLALGILGEAEEAGIDVPGDLSVMGFDNITYSGLPKINLTTIEQPKKTMGSLSVDMLLERINDPDIGYSHRILAPSLVERGSCRSIL